MSPFTHSYMSSFSVQPMVGAHVLETATSSSYATKKTASLWQISGQWGGGWADGCVLWPTPAQKPCLSSREDQCKVWNPFFEHGGQKHQWLPYQHPERKCPISLANKQTHSQEPDPRLCRQYHLGGGGGAPFPFSKAMVWFVHLDSLDKPPQALV